MPLYINDDSRYGYHICSSEELQMVHEVSSQALDGMIHTLNIATIEGANTYLQLLRVNAETRLTLS